MPEARQHTKYWWSLPCHGDVLAEGSQKVNEKLKQVQHDKNFGRICKVQDAKYVSEAHRKHLFPYSPITLFTSKKAAFTLAEVLITLGIIGIVAAMTIPTLISNYKKKSVESKLVKFYSTMTQAIKLSELDNGSVENWDLIEYETIDDDAGNVLTNHATNGLEWFNKYFAPYLKTAKAEELENNLEGQIAVYFQDGSLVLIGFNSWLYYPEAKDFKQIESSQEGYNDRDKQLSGKKYFTFKFYNSDVYFVNKNLYSPGLQPYVHTWDGTKETLLTASDKGCQENITNERAYCTKLIQMNNWKIPDDYFYKF